MVLVRGGILSGLRVGISGVFVFALLRSALGHQS